MLRRVLELSIRHRKPVVLATALVGLLGVFALRDLPIDAVPDVTPNQVQVNTLFAPLSPLEIEQQVTFPIETALAGIPGLRATRSLSRNGFSQVTAVFDDAVDVYFARMQVSERLDQARESLPPGAEPRLGPLSTGLGEITMWTLAFAAPPVPAPEGQPGWQPDGSYLTPEGERLTSELERLAYLRTVQDWIVRPQLRGVEGVAEIDAIGGHVKQYHVQPDPMKLVSYGLGFGDVITALERNNVSIGAGYVEHGGEAYLVRSAGRIEHPSEIERVVVGARRGIPIYLSDVGTVGVGREPRTGSAGAGGVEGVVGTALMRVGANSRTVAAAVARRLGEVRRSLPPGVELTIVLDRSRLVDATVATVRANLLEGAALVIVVLFVLLGNFRAALIAALAIPLSMLVTATGMVRAGVSGNLMSLGAIDFGLIVDGAVIVVENCLRVLGERRRALGRALTLAERLEAVRDASTQVRRPTAFGEAIIIVAYLPVLALTGVEGKLFHPMALTVILALAAAFLLSLTFVPAMVALLVTGEPRARAGWPVRAAQALYRPVLAWSLAHPRRVVLAAVLACAGALALAGRLGQEFVPTLDEQDLALHVYRIPSTSLTQSTAMQLEVERALAALPEVERVFSKTGTAEMASDPMPPSVSDTFVMLRPRAQWPDAGLAKAELVGRMEQALARLPGNGYEFTQPIQMRFNELIAGVRGDVAVKVKGDDFARMRATAEELAAVLRRVPGAADVQVEATSGLPVLSVHVDRGAIARHGLSVADVQDVVAAAVGGRAAGVVFEGDRRFELVVRLPEELRRDLDALERLPVPLPRADAAAPAPAAGFGSEPEADDGRPGAGLGSGRAPGFVPLGSLARIEISEGPNQISRENGKRRVVVQANVRGRDLGSFVAEARAASARVALPPGGWLEWGGQFENLVAARARLALVVPLCFALVFLLLFASLDSARLALLVFSAVPLGLGGGVLALWLRGMPFSISAAVGFIALSGVAVLNGLVMVGFIEELRRGGAALGEAITRGSLARLRPVLTTALVASLGFLPMALATGTGAEVQEPLATVVIGGLLSSTLLTLLVLPALYRLFARRPAGAG